MQDYTSLSPMNDQYSKLSLKVANGAQFTALLMSENEALDAKNVLYIHIHRESKRCYIGQALKKCRLRWANGSGYRLEHQPKFRSAINSYGWTAFDSYILCFSDDKVALDNAETLAIAAAGGHRSVYVYNLAPGGRVTVDRSEALEGFNLKTKEWMAFANSVAAAEYIGIQKSGNIRRVVKGENKSAGGWWFRVAGSTDLPPDYWGIGSAKQETKPVMAIRLTDEKEFIYKSISEAARQIGVHSSNVTHAVKRSTGGTCKGYWLRYLDVDISKPKLVGRAGGVYKNGKPVIATNISTGEETIFLSGRMAAKQLGVSDKNMPGALKGRIKSLGGYTFRYLEVKPDITN